MTRNALLNAPFYAVLSACCYGRHQNCVREKQLPFEYTHITLRCNCDCHTGTCFWCGIDCQKTHRDYASYQHFPNKATREHLVPKSLGGGDGKNVVLACYKCNNGRGRDMTWIPFSEVPEGMREIGVPMRINLSGNWVRAL